MARMAAASVSATLRRRSDSFWRALSSAALSAAFTTRSAGLAGSAALATSAGTAGTAGTASSTAAGAATGAATGTAAALPALPGLLGEVAAAATTSAALAASSAATRSASAAAWAAAAAASAASRATRSSSSWCLRASAASASCLAIDSACSRASNSKRCCSSSSALGPVGSSALGAASSRLMKVRFLRTSTWMVRALPLASACLISLVDFFVSVIFLRSAAATVPWDVRRNSSKRSLSDSLKASSGETLATPAECNCSSNAEGWRLSCAASWATVVTAMDLVSFRDSR